MSAPATDSPDLAARVAALEAEVQALKRAAFSPDDLLTIAEVAELRGCSVAALHKAVQRGRLPVVRRGRALLVRRGDL